MRSVSVQGLSVCVYEDSRVLKSDWRHAEGGGRQREKRKRWSCKAKDKQEISGELFVVIGGFTVDDFGSNLIVVFFLH